MKNSNIIDFSSILNKKNEIKINIGTYENFFIEPKLNDINEFSSFLNDSTYKVPSIKKNNKTFKLNNKFIEYSYIWCLANYLNGDKIHLLTTSIFDLPEDLVINLLLEAGFDLNDEEENFSIPNFLVYQCFIERNNQFYSVLGTFGNKNDLINIFISNESNEYYLIETNNDIEFTSILQELDIITNYQMTTYLKNKYLK